jgi:hypothetical protein
MKTTETMTTTEIRMQAMIYIIESSANYTCGNVRWKKDGAGMIIFNTYEREDIFYGATDVLALFTAFNSYVISKKGIIYLYIY